MRQSISAALALVFALVPLAAGAQPPLGADATQYRFQGCDPHLCTTLDFFVSPASSYAQHPPGAAYAIGFNATHQILDAGDGLGVLAWFSVDAYNIVGVPRQYYWDDQLGLGINCWSVMYPVFRTSGSCVEGLLEHSGWTAAAITPTAAEFKYSLGPAGQPYDATTVPFMQRRMLQLTLVDDFTPVPEPATFALLTGGLLALGVGVGRHGAARPAQERTEES